WAKPAPNARRANSRAIALRNVPVFLTQHHRGERNARKSVRLGARCVIPAQTIATVVPAADRQSPPSGQTRSLSSIELRSCSRQCHAGSREPAQLDRAAIRIWYLVCTHYYRDHEDAAGQEWSHGSYRAADGSHSMNTKIKPEEPRSLHIHESQW